MLNVLITGAQGHVGSALQQLLDSREYRILTTDIDEMDITNHDQVSQYMKINRPDVIINCAGFTDVEACEADPDKAYLVNAIGVRNLAEAAEQINAKFIQISTDDVFNSKAERPYNEFDETSPKSVYGKSKLAGEKIVTQLCNRFVIIRSSWNYGIGKDFVDELLSAVGKKETFNVAKNRYGVPTSTKEVAKVIQYFIDNDEYGIYHAVCKGSCNRYEFAQAILEYTGNTDKIKLIPVDKTDVLRPDYCVLDNMMLRLTGIEEPAEWRAALKEYLDETGGLE